MICITRAAAERVTCKHMMRTPPQIVQSDVVMRVSGLPVNAVTALRSSDLAQLLAAIARIDDVASSQRELISILLHCAIRVTPEQRVRGELLKVRRMLYKGDVPSVKLRATLEHLEPADRQQVTAYITHLEERVAMTSTLTMTYNDAVVHSRRHLQSALRDLDFQKGLLLSSRTLFGNLQRYLAAKPERVGSRDEQIERGLLRYFTRASMKATPFARFCAIASARFVPASYPRDHASPSISFDRSPRTKRGFVRLNKRLYGALWEYLKRMPAVREQLVIDLNPTLNTSEDRLSFLASVKSDEVFQRMPRTEPLDAVLSLIREKHEPTFGDLINIIIADPSLETTADEAIQYLNALVACGLLRFRSLVPEQVAEWDVPLRNALVICDDSRAQAIVSLLSSIRALADRYAIASVAERESITGQVQDLLRTAFDDDSLTSPRWVEPVFYEDAATEAEVSIPMVSGVESTLNTLCEWVALTRPFVNTRADQATMRHFFDVHYPDQSSVPLMSFYEDYFREHLRDHGEKQRRARAGIVDHELESYDLSNPFRLERIWQLQSATARLTRMLASQWDASPNADQIDFNRDTLVAAFGDMSGAPASECSSVSFFCQLVIPHHCADASMAVVYRGQYSVGFGKYLSRFLYMLPDAVRERVYASNRELAGTSFLAEICGDAQFNANLHPPLLPFEIGYPTGEGGASNAQLPSANIDVRRDPDDPFALCLEHRPTGTRVFPVDLGFLNPERRPALFQLLTRFTPGGAFGISLPETPFSPSGEPSTIAVAEAIEEEGPPPMDIPTSLAPLTPKGLRNDGATKKGLPLPPLSIVRRPRLVYGGHVVIARQRWKVPGSLMPRLTGGEDDAAFLLRVDRWRRAHGIPERVYVRVLAQKTVQSQMGITLSTAEATTSDTPDDGALNGIDDIEAAHEDDLVGVTVPHEVGLVSQAPPLAAPVISDATGRGTRTHRAANRPSRDFAKPQFIDFASPLLVQLFARLPGALPSFFLLLEECYPETSALPMFGKDAFTCEMIVQLDHAAGHNVSSNVDSAPGGVSEAYGPRVSLDV